MPDIRVLDELTANQIAAGEVVERPASVVKELVENSLDAGARRIEVAIVQGGLQEVSVADDGSGIPADQAELAFVRHATSKLRAVADFRRLRSLGFRGEALPSIASVSRVTMRTRVAAAEAGVELRYEGTALVARSPAGCPVGTRVQVRDLFYNTPARLKFVRSLHTETAHVIETVERAAAARPDVSFSVSVDGKRQWETDGDGTLPAVFLALYGYAPASRALAVIGESSDYRIEGLVGAAEDARKSRTGLWFSVNGRPVRSLALMQAVLDGFGTRLASGRYPLGMLQLHLDPALVDVNVHPGKLEVRFSEEKDVRAFVAQAVTDALAVGMVSPSLRAGFSSRDQAAERAVSGPADRLPAVLGRPAAAPRESEGPVVPGAALQMAFAIQEPVPTAYTAGGDIRRTEALVRHVGVLRPVAQVLEMYIVAEDGETVYLIDQHAAHERVLYERFRAAFDSGAVRALPLLVPVTLDVAPHEVSRLERFRPLAASFGLVYEAFGERSFVVRSVPNIWEGLALEQIVRDALGDLLDENGTPTALAMQERLVMRACKAAVKANDRLSLPEMEALLAALGELENPFTCPHGRPTALRITRHQLEREFGRSK